MTKRSSKIMNLDPDSQVSDAHAFTKLLAAPKPGIPMTPIATPMYSLKANSFLAQPIHILPDFAKRLNFAIHRVNKKS
jgi:hypothetical protein